MKKCDGHQAAFGCSREIAVEDGYLLDAQFMQESLIQEKAVGIGQKLGFSRDEYKKKLNELQGFSPWLICDECLSLLNLSEMDQRLANEQAMKWLKDKNISGHNPGEKNVLAENKVKKVNRSSEPNVNDADESIFKTVRTIKSTEPESEYAHLFKFRFLANSKKQAELASRAVIQAGFEAEVIRKKTNIFNKLIFNNKWQCAVIGYLLVEEDVLKEFYTKIAPIMFSNGCSYDQISVTLENIPVT